MVKKKEDYLIRKVAGREVKLDADTFYNPKILNSTLILSKAGQVFVRNRKTRKTTALARIVIKAKKKQVVDHINRNPLDNRRSNLRIVTNRQNMLNRILKNSTGFIGVSIRRKTKDKPKYCAIYFTGNKRLCFYSPFTPNGLILAAMARDKFIILNSDEEYAPLNFPIFKQEPFKTILLASDLYEMRTRTDTD
ncbi:MAG: HNH endonuclease signature motif containing protein [Sedimentisphaerales bacterium]